jgi:hypothetical protein
MIDLKLHFLTPWPKSASEVTDQATTACQRIYYELLRIEGVA